LLPVAYYLITFTVPEGLRAWLRSTKSWATGSCSKSAGTLQDVPAKINI
jgi:hypothetical protein